jgi:hypothetical protein
MKELKCPKCGTAFQVNEADYASIVSQVKNEEFERELQRRTDEIQARAEAERVALRAKSEQEMQLRIVEKEAQMNEKEQEIVRLREQVQNAGKVKELEMESEILKREQQINELRARLEQAEGVTKVAVMTEQTKSLNALNEKDMLISDLRNQLQIEQQQALIRETALKEQHHQRLRLAEEQIAIYRDMRSRLSTKMVGETLEEHCRVEYERNLRALLPNASFDKDNDASDGTKGDFIFRIQEDGLEYLSIMFEMKNESEVSVNKHKNIDHLKKLDEDRKKKGCEYAVLVSTLEADSELYNMGIVDMSYLYEKMYVIRPQFFVPIITLLTKAAQKSIAYQRDLAIARSQSIDITKFEDELEEFKHKFGESCRHASNKFATAIASIDTAIEKLEATKKALLTTEKHLNAADNHAEGLTIRKLTHKNPTMKQKFAEARAAKEASYDVLE